MTDKNHKLDIFEVLKNISNSKYSYWKSLSENEQKSFSPLIIMRWLSSKDSYEIYMLNHLLNKYIFNLGKHKQLLFNLMCISTKPNSQYSWIKREVPGTQYSKSIKVLNDYLNYSSRESREALKFYSNDNIIEMANELGYQKEDIQLLKSELKKR